MILYSLTFGVMAWLIALFGAVNIIRKPTVTLFLSFTLGFASVASMLIDIMRRVRAEDISAIMDTAKAIVLGLGVMMTVTVMLNLTAMIAYAVRQRKKPDQLGK